MPNHQYDDISDLPRPVSRRHRHMPIEERAVQYAPFAALACYEEILMEVARSTQECPQLSEDEQTRLDALLRQLRGGPAASVREVRTYHDRLLDAYRQRLSGDLPVMHRMWELWTYLAAGFNGAEPYLKRMRKAKNLSEYQAAVDALLREQPLVYSKEG